MIIRFNENLQVEEIDAEESINAGNNLVNEIKVFMPSNFDFNSHKGYANFRLSDGKEYNNLIMERTKKENLELIEEKCYYYTLPRFLTKQKGPLLLTVRISPIDNIAVIANSGVITTTVNYAIFENGEEVVDPDIAEQLRQEIAEGEIRINEALEKSNEALEKANDALYHDATIVKINGEVQQTWDATFAQEQYEKSLNLLYVPDIPETTKSGLTYSSKDGIITINGTATSNVELISLDANLSSGKTYAFNYFNSGYGGDFQWGLYSNGNYAGGIFSNKGTKTLSANVNKVNLTANSGTVFNNQQFKPMIVEGNIVPTTYFANNPKYHITNSEAEFLKDEHNKGINLFIKNMALINYELNGSNGSANPSNDWFTSHYMNVEGMTNVYVSGGRSGGSSFCFYDSNKTFISKQDLNYTGLLTIPTNATYLRFNGRIAEMNVMVNEGSEPLPYMEGYGQIVREVDITSVLAWENATPGSTFAPSTNIKFSGDASKYKYAYLSWYVSTNISSLAPTITKIELDPNKASYFRVSSASNNAGNVATRVFAIAPHDTFLVQNGYVDGVVNDDIIIPYKLYLSNI